MILSQLFVCVAVNLVLDGVGGDQTLFRQASKAVQADFTYDLARSSATYSLPGRSLMGGTGEDAFTYDIPLAPPGEQNRAALLEQFPAPNATSNSGLVDGGRGGSHSTTATKPQTMKVDALSPTPAQTTVTGNGAWSTYNANSGVISIHAVPLTNGQLFLMERPNPDQAAPQIAAVYNLNSNTFKYFPMTDSPFCSGQISLTTGNALVVGGDNLHLEPVPGDFHDGRFNIRVFYPGVSPSYSIVATMAAGPNYPVPAGNNGKPDPNAGARWYPGLVTVPTGNLLIVGGQTTEGGTYGTVNSHANPTYQYFLVSSNKLTATQPLAQLQNTVPINLYPWLAVMPATGIVCIICGAQTRFYTPDANAGTLTLSNAHPPIANLPVPVSYPQTASIVLLPLELPDYAPRILVVGGSSQDHAGGGTAASHHTYLLDLTATNPTWTQETLSCPRVMPDAILLPDGTVGVFNGAEVGIAGGVFGKGNARSTDGKPRSPEIYNPAFAIGSRMSGLLASNGRNRFYHSSAFLTANAEVLISGSETTGDYAMQIYTPPYLAGTFSRPVINSPSTLNPGYSAAFTVALTWAGGAASTITRVVLNRDGGITHSTHFDQRQVACAFTATATQLTITAPPNNFVAPPGSYQLFAVSAAGRPSQAIDIGIGGAKILANLVANPATPILANGQYNILLAGRTSCYNYFSPSTCAQGTHVSMNTTGVFNLTYLPHAPVANTYEVTVPARASCKYFLSCASCDGKSTLVNLSVEDTNSGRQQWTFVSVTGGYHIAIRTGREGCGDLLTGQACGNDAVNLETAGNGLQVWSVTNIAAG